MRIDEDQFFYGAALIQIAEHPSFTAINDYKENDATVRCAYGVNQNIGVYLRYDGRPRPEKEGDGVRKFFEYDFNFNRAARDTLARMSGKFAHLYLGLVCVQSREICCVSYQEFQELLAFRESLAGSEEQFTVNVRLLERSSFRVFVKEPGTRSKESRKPRTIGKNQFPSRIFGEGQGELTDHRPMT
jgi:hypothetical protein